MKFPLHFTLLAISASALSTGLQLQAGTVINNNDSGAGSLRNAIAAATNGETIDFAPALNGATITLTIGHLSITGLEVTIDASALPAGIKISGNSNSRIFSISAGSDVTLKSLELFNGSVTGDSGGGIYAVNSELNCTNITVRDCASTGLGGGILAFQSQLHFVNTTIRNCASTFDGGGLWANNVTGIIDRCSFLGNDSQSFGGGIIIIGNNSPTISNTVISGNRCPLGGGISTSSSPQIINCTIQGNSGAGIQLEGMSGAPVLRNTIVWGNRTGDGTISSQQIRNGVGSSASANVDYSLIEGAAGTLNNLDGTLPANDPDFVNPATPVDSSTAPSSSSDVRFFIGSPVLNVGNNGSNSTLLDRAGKTRTQDTTIDLGAFEGGYVTFGLLHPSLDPSEDDNGNGISNFGEYAAGTDPSGPDDPAARPMISQTGGFNFLTTSQRCNSLDVDFSWETSTTMETLSWQEMVWGINHTVESTSNPSPGRQELVFKLLDTDPSRFYRQVFRTN